jgi:hypothetical protein
MNTNTTSLRPPATNGAAPRASTAAGAPRAPAGLRAAWLLSAAIAVLMAAASAAGLWVQRLYPDPTWASAALRGGDLVSLAVATPVLLVALVGAIRGSRRAQLVWIGTLAYAVYNYAYYVFGSAFNDIFLLHVALFGASVFALGLALASLDAGGIAAAFSARTPARWIGGFLLATGAALGGAWGWLSLRFAITGKLPGGVYPAAAIHLVYTLDLALLAPSLVLAGVLLWRRAAWGLVLGTVLCVYGAAYQLNYLVATNFQAHAHVAGAVAFAPSTLLLTGAFLLAALLLLASLRPARR